jgi:hypothetical protein
MPSYHSHSQAKRLIAAFLRLRLDSPSLHSLSIGYTGGGDTGYVQTINLFPEEVDRTLRLQPRFSDLRKELDQLAWELVALEHGGFWNGNGGEGTVRVGFLDDSQPNTVTVTLEHHQNRVITQEISDSWNYPISIELA